MTARTGTRPQADDADDPAQRIAALQATLDSPAFRARLAEAARQREQTLAAVAASSPSVAETAVGSVGAGAMSRLRRRVAPWCSWAAGMAAGLATGGIGAVGALFLFAAEHESTAMPMATASRASVVDPVVSPSGALAPVEPPPANERATPSTDAVAAAPATTAQGVAPLPVAPSRPLRVTLIAAAQELDDPTSSITAALEDAGVEIVARHDLALASARSVVRYFHQADADAAQDLARATGAEAIALPRYRPRPPARHIELVLASGAAAALSEVE